MTQIIALDDSDSQEILELLLLAQIRIYDCNTDTYYNVLDLSDNQVTITATRSFTIKSIMNLIDLIGSSGNLSLVRSGTIFIMNDHSVMYSQNRDTLLNL